MRRDCIHKSFDLNVHVKLQNTSETSKRFENNILSGAIQSAFEINIAQFFITVVGSCSHVLGNKKVKCIMFHSGFSGRIKNIVSRKFSRLTNAISEQKISHVMDGRVCYS